MNNHSNSAYKFKGVDSLYSFGCYYKINIRTITAIASLLVGYALFCFCTACQSNPYKHGEILYQNFCMNCHMEDGTGLVGNIPPLAGADFLVKSKEQLPCIIRYGIQDTLVVNGIAYTAPMEGIPQLTDIEITNIINYINHSWGNDNGFTKPTDVAQYLKACK